MRTEPEAAAGADNGGAGRTSPPRTKKGTRTRRRYMQLNTRFVFRENTMVEQFRGNYEIFTF